MNSGATAERVYESLKALILSSAYRPGERLDPGKIGMVLHSSVTPVRDALHLLAGEGLVETRLGEGFRLAPIDGPGLQDLYAWNAEILGLALRAGVSSQPLPMPEEETALGGEGGGPMLFLAIASRSPNSEHRRAILSLNDRLAQIRICEDDMFPEAAEEIDSIRSLLDAGDRRQLRQSISAYHRRRQKAAHELVRKVYRAGRG